METDLYKSMEPYKAVIDQAIDQYLQREHAIAADAAYAKQMESLSAKARILRQKPKKKGTDIVKKKRGESLKQPLLLSDALSDVCGGEKKVCKSVKI